MNINDLSLPQLLEHHKAVVALVLERSEDHRKSLKAERDRIDAELAALGENHVSAKASHSRKGAKIAPKYRHGDNTWSGRGMQPKWLAEALRNGGTLDDYRVAA